MRFVCKTCSVFEGLVFLLVFNVEWRPIHARDSFSQSEAYDPSVLLSYWESPVDRVASWCQYRELPMQYNSNVFRLQSSFGCYIYTSPSRFNPEVGVYKVSSNVTDGLPYQLVVVDDVKHDVDYQDPKSIALISKSLLSLEDTQKWIECSIAAGECCNFMLSHQNTLGYCPATWDAWYCWHEAPADTFQHAVCPDYIYSGSPPLCHHESSKRCFPNGTWNVTTNYATCAITSRIKDRTIYHVTMLSISLAVSIPAIVIFFSYRKLRTTMRVILNRNLLIAIVIRNILTIISKTTIILDAITVKNEADSVMAHNGVGCKILTVLEKLATNAVFACMLLLGIYLHRLIAAAFRGEPKMLYYFIGAAAMSTLPVLAWSAVTATLNNRYCWTVDDSGFQWINDSVKIAMLTVNMVLIVDIIRVLVTKLGRVNTGNSKNIRRTTKATIFLLPVFGVQFVFTAARPATTNCTSEQVFYYFSYGLDGIQGAVVSLFFCYLNNEVRSLLGRTLTGAKNAVRMRMDKDFVPRNSSAQDDPRRTTFSTMVEPNHKDLSAPPTPILNRTSVTEPTNIAREHHQQEIFRTPKTSESENTKPEDFGSEFFTPRHSLAESPSISTLAFYSPRSSFAGSALDVNFYDCIDDLTNGFDLQDIPNDRRRRKDIVYSSSLTEPSYITGFTNAAEKFNDDFHGSLEKSLHENSKDMLSSHPITSANVNGVENRGLSLSTENLPDDANSALRRRNPSLENNFNVSEA